MFVFRYKRDKKKNKMKMKKGEKGASIRGQITYSKAKIRGYSLPVID